MMFAKQLRSRIRRGEITTTIRIWRSARVKVGGRYPMERGQVEVLSIDPIQIKDITSAMATESGFDSVADLLTTARHGSGTNVYFIRFRYIKAPRILDE